MFAPVGPDRMQTTQQVVLPILHSGSGIRLEVEIPTGYTFDGASIPRLAWSAIGAPFEPDFIFAACVHDWFCEVSSAGGNYQIRVIGDAVFFALLTKAGVPRWKRTFMYLAVRMYSWWRYGRNA